jgi:hypothetical protein
MFNVRTLTYKLELMDTLAHQLEKADRLAAVTQSVGFALWQLQELEGASAEYFVLLTQAKQGMGLEAGNALVEKAQAKTFGATLRQIAKAGLIPTEIESRFTKLLSERNWLVHRSRLDSRNVIYRAHAMRDLIARLEVIADEALALLKYIGAGITAFTQKHGVSGSMSFRVERATTDLRRCAGIATVTSGVASVDGAVKGGQSPAKRTLYCAINASKLKGLGLVAVFRGQPPSPSGGKDFPALEGRDATDLSSTSSPESGQ